MVKGVVADQDWRTVNNVAELLQLVKRLMDIHRAPIVTRPKNANPRPMGQLDGLLNYARPVRSCEATSYARRRLDPIGKFDPSAPQPAAGTDGRIRGHFRFLAYKRAV
jgi:hypothetical protein